MSENITKYTKGRYSLFTPVVMKSSPLDQFTNVWKVVEVKPDGYVIEDICGEFFVKTEKFHKNFKPFTKERPY